MNGHVANSAIRWRLTRSRPQDHGSKREQSDVDRAPHPAGRILGKRDRRIFIRPILVYNVLMTIRLGGFPRRQMRVVRGLTCAVLLILAACVGGTTSAGVLRCHGTNSEGLIPSSPAGSSPTRRTSGRERSSSIRPVIFSTSSTMPNRPFAMAWASAGKALSGPGVRQSVASRNGPTRTAA